MKKKILITQQELANYGGSEVVTLELSNYFLDLGFEVVIFTNFFGPPISREFNPKVKIVDQNTKINIRSFSHIWVHHNLVPFTLLDLLSKGDTLQAKVAFHHMSPYLPIESPLIPSFEESIADFIYFNSPETMKAYERLFSKKDHLAVLGNPAPDKFANNVPKRTSKESLDSILVVSNHMPLELSEALKRLSENGVTIETLGVSGNPELVSPEKLDKYDVVVSIGKTVQYSFVRGVPVYCYDHFGGSGYLSLKNFSKNREFNFSGRGFKKKNPEAIAEELVLNYKKAVVDAEQIRDLYSKDFLLTPKLKDFSEVPISVKQKTIEQTDLERLGVLVTMNVSNIKSIIYLRNELLRTKDANVELNRINTSLVDENGILQKRLKNTLDYRIKRFCKKVLKLVSILS